MKQDELRKIPKMDQLLERPALRALCMESPRGGVREAVRLYLDELRLGLCSGALEQLPSAEEMEAAVCTAVHAACRYHLRPLINATGVVLHTNLGRAPLGDEIARHVSDVAAGYSNLEYRLEQGERGSRYAHVEELLCGLTGAEAALVVNNNAAAVFLMLNTLAKGKAAAVSRGELVEIGGSFRIPEIMAQSGAALVEVGTTNKTRVSDYAAALEQGAEVLLKVHASNFKLTGFTEEASIAQLSALAQKYGAPLLYDLGSGFLIRPESVGLHDVGSIYVPDAVKLCDVVCFSGDKLVGGTQAGILLGRRELIERMKTNPLNRVLRIDKLTLAALEAVLRWYQDGKQTLEKIPTLRMLRAGQDTLLERARALAARLADCAPALCFSAESCLDEPGGGSLPAVTLPGGAVAVTGASPADLAARLRAGEPPVIGRIHRNRLLLSMRTLTADDEAALCSVFAALEGSR
ncbi:MAG: L-seryl-tRNA(Sec) selenium transferase [Oscillospiraceae bacterium]|nr:L-seryl-tRNA(Sec) selenium transferase [Oscillospiraceae bacterium]